MMEGHFAQVNGHKFDEISVFVAFEGLFDVALLEFEHCWVAADLEAQYSENIHLFSSDCIDA